MSKPALKPKPTREQIISARRIVFRRSLKQSNESNAVNSEPQYAIQQVRSANKQNYKHFEAKMDRNNEQQLHWSRCKPKDKAENFRAYQNGDLNEFFDGDDNRRVSDVCLMNDHFILVKLPAQEGQNPAEIQCIVNHVENRPILPHAQNEQRANTRPRRVQPMESAVVGIQTVKEFKPVSKVPAALRHIHWKKDLEEQTETYETRTEIKKIFRRDSPMPKSILNSSLKDKSESCLAKTDALNGKPTPFQVVELQNQAALVCLEGNEEPDPAVLRTWEPQTNPKRPALRALQWLINPFCLRFRRRKRPKPKPKIQAVIYKTYFMRWTKPADVDCCKSGAHRDGYNSRTLRRIRSALF